MKENKWRITKINDGFGMTRIEGQVIACRELNWFERIIYRNKLRGNYGIKKN